MTCHGIFRPTKHTQRKRVLNGECNGLRDTRCVPARVKICTIPNGICEYFLYRPLKEELKSELEKTDYRVIEPIHLANQHLLGGSRYMMRIPLSMDTYMDSDIIQRTCRQGIDSRLPALNCPHPRTRGISSRAW